MLFGAKGGCQQCTCVPCDACTKTCTNPHTGSAFATVYTRYFEGAEAGHPTDGYLTATGDSDTSDPYDGMDGTGPWYQRVSGGFSFTPSGTRFPCTIRVSFWRNSYVLGASTIPPPSSSLTENTIEVIVTQGAIVTPDGRVITPADGAVAVSSVPIVSASGDAAGSDPRSFDGTVSFQPQCNNVETIFTIRATIRWNTKKRQHVLYGIVRECYGSDCDTFCSGSPPPAVLYLTITNANVTAAPSGAPSASALNAVLDAWIENKTWVLDRYPNFCQTWGTDFIQYGPCNGLAGNGGTANAHVSQWSDGIVRFGVYMQTDVEGYGCYGGAISLAPSSTYPSAPVCGSAYLQTGTSSHIVLLSGGGVEYTYTGTFDWKVQS